MKLRWLSAFVVLSACGGASEAREEDQLQPVVDSAAPVQKVEDSKSAEPTEPKVQDASAMVSFGGPSPDVQLTWSGIGALHKGFFSSPPQLKALSADLAKARVLSPATVHVAFDSSWHVGKIQLMASAQGPLSRIPVQDQGIALQDLHLITEALARYRSAVAGRFDLRIDSFHIGVVARSGNVECVFGLGGPHPPDGTKVSHCVQINGKEHCGRQVGPLVQFDPPVVEQLMACLQPSRNAQ